MPESDRSLLLSGANRPRSLTGAFVWASWLAMVGMAFVYIGRYALPIPYADEWSMVAAATGHEAVDVAWYWRPHNEHRMPLPKWVYLEMGRLTGFRFERMPLMNLGLLAAASAALLVATAVARGTYAITDCVIPAVLMHLGHQVNLTWGFQINFCLCTALVTAIMASMLLAERSWKATPTIVETVCLLSLPACGAFGLLYVGPIATWLGVRGAAAWRAGDRRQGGPMVVSAMAALANMAIYLIWFPKLTSDYVSKSAVDIARGVFNLITTSVGPLGRGIYPISGALLLAALVGAVWIACRTIARGASNKNSIIGLLTLAGACGLLCLAMAYGRAGHGPATTLQSRYGLLIAPLPICLYLLFDRCGIRIGGHRGGLVALALVALFVGINDRKGLRDGHTRRAWMDHVARAARDGRLDAPMLAEYSARLQSTPEELARHFERLRGARLPPYETYRAGQPGWFVR